MILFHFFIICFSFLGKSFWFNCGQWNCFIVCCWASGFSSWAQNRLLVAKGLENEDKVKLVARVVRQNRGASSLLKFKYALDGVNGTVYVLVVDARLSWWLVVLSKWKVNLWVFIVCLTLRQGIQVMTFISLLLCARFGHLVLFNSTLLRYLFLWSYCGQGDGK